MSETKTQDSVKTISKSDKRRRLNIILDVCKYRGNKKAIQCFDDDCQEIKEMPIMSVRKRRRGNGTLETKETDTGNIVVSCETHDWRELFSISQLDNLKMPKLDGPGSNVVER